MLKEFDIEKLNVYVKQAFKKLKSAAYFDKTQPVMRVRIMEFEADGPDSAATFNARVNEIASVLGGESNEEWEQYADSLIDSVSVLTYPKSVRDPSRDGRDDYDWRLITNRAMQPPAVDKLQLFIDMKVEGFVLGMLWVMLVGARLDRSFAKCSYGNRIRKDVERDGTLTWSPYIFEPYFSQYGKWRDGALDVAERAHNDGVDVAMLTLDFKSFYYSVDMQESDWANLLSKATSKHDDDHLKRTCARLSFLVRRVVEKYSACVCGDEDARTNMLPIGFAPSPIIANWCLDDFDARITSQLNPLFYGRYVDDIIIVEKVEDNDAVRNEWRDGKLEVQRVFMRMFCPETTQLFLADFDDMTGCGGRHRDEITVRDSLDQLAQGTLVVNPLLLNAPSSKIEIQGEKVKVFYFDHGAPYALIQQFREAIARNSSEFRLMPNVKSLSLKDSYSTIYEMHSGDSPNKFREVDGIHLNSFELSKFLGKCERLGPILSEDAREAICGKEILSLFEPSVIIGCYPTWEKLFEIAISFEDDELLVQLVERIAHAIDSLSVDAVYEKQCSAIGAFERRLKDTGICQALKKTLYRALEAYSARALALLWGPHYCEVVKHVAALSERLDLERIRRMRQLTCKTYMLDKYAMAILPHFVLPALIGGEDSETSRNLRLTKLSDVQHALALADDKLPFGTGFDQADVSDVIPLFPYIVKANDLEYAYYTWALEPRRAFPTPSELNEYVKRQYELVNFMGGEQKEIGYIQVGEAFALDDTSVFPRRFAITVPEEPVTPTKVTVAMANVKLQDADAESALYDNALLTHKRYTTIELLTSAALHEGADLFVLPELCVPYSWLPRLMAFSANNGMAIVCGVEHVPSSRKDVAGGRRWVRNLTAVILPYVHKDTFRFAKLTLHEKVSMAPAERKMIENAGHAVVEGTGFELYKWRGLWFPLYCCFELVSIKYRSLFSACADLLVTVEWNRDTNYFSNIIGSLARDLSCCCVQVNNSVYGDSRITMPDKTEKMDLARVKGGFNDAILVSEIDVQAIRDCQMKLDGGVYKPPSPDFDREIVRHKINGGLLDWLRERSIDGA